MENKNLKTIILGSTVVVLIVIIGVLAALFIWSPGVKVPDFKDKKIEDVQTWITDNKVDEEKYEIIHEFSETIQKDYVISQSIEADQVIKKEEKLTIKISDGKDPNLVVTIPDFNGKTEAEIKHWFEENLFTDVTYEYVPNDKVAKEKFVALNVTDNNQKRSALIVVTISAGTETIGLDITIPDFKDYTKANIQAWAKTNHYTVTFKNQSSPTVESGKVISQDPAAGSKSKTGEKMTVTLSTGKGVTAVDFTGKTKAEADKWLKENGLKGNFTQIYSGTVKTGIIISNNPSKGVVTPGSTIAFNTSIGLVPIENYTNKQIADFESYIKTLNSKYNNSAKIAFTKAVENSNLKEGTIISITIAGKAINATTEVAPGTSIQVKVAGAAKITVDNKAGTKEADFKNYITGLGLVLGNKTEKYDDSKAAGLLISNDTGSYDKGARINYVLSKGTFTVDANSFNNKAFTEAQNQINAANNLGAGWSISKTESNHDSIASGNVIGCSVSGKTLTCNVSKGKPAVAPDFIGKQNPCGQVQPCMVSNVKVSVKMEFSDTVASGLVISQSVAKGTVLTNNEMSVTVSKGKEIKEDTVDNKAGSSENDFKSYISNIKMTLGTRSERYDDSKANGTIISNDTGKKALGTPINYVVSKGSFSIDPNSLTGKPFTDAQGQINSANSLGAGWSINKNDVNHDSVPSGNIVGCSVSGKALNCDVSKGKVEVAMCTLPDMSPLNAVQNNPNGFEGAKSIISSMLSGFTNVTYEKVSGESNPNGYDGIFQSITPDSPTNLACNTALTVKIYSK